MIRVGITGQSGFVGTHLYNSVKKNPDRFNPVEFNDTFFLNESELDSFVSNCDVIIHLAAINRHSNLDVLYETNIELVRKIIDSCERTKSRPHILFSSSTQEDRDNHYGRSKVQGRLLFEEWAKKNNSCFTGLIIPNVYGPFGNPYYNSVVATFCYQLTNNEVPKIDIDSNLQLIYIGELVEEIIKNIELVNINSSKNISIVQQLIIQHTSEVKVSELLEKLSVFKNNYFERGVIPNLNIPFNRNLFNTLLCYINHDNFFPFKLEMKTDERGSFVETIKLNSGGQVSFSSTKQGVTRGNHYHTRKAERFAIIKGNAKIEIRRIGTNNKSTFYLSGDQPSFVDMPIWYTHNITNIGNEDLYTLFWISEHYNPEDPDTYFENV